MRSILERGIWGKGGGGERGKGGGGRREGDRHIDELSSRQMVSRGGPFVWHKPRAWSLPLGLPIAKDRYLPPKAYTVLKVQTTGNP